MAVKVDVALTESFNTSASPETVYALLSDVKASAAHYPDVENLIDEGNNVFRWETKEVGFKGFSHQVIYASEYISDSASKTVSWTPAGGNSNVAGSWKIEADGSGSRVTLVNELNLDVPVPRLLKGMAQPFVQGEVERQVKEYLKNLKTALDAS